MVHGAGGGGWEYKFWQEVFEQKGWEVRAPDMMPSEKGLAKTSLDDYIAQTIKAAGDAKPVVLIGASMGGVLVLKAAEEVNASAVVLVNGTAPRAVIEQPRLTDDVPEVIRWANGPLQDTEDAMPDSDRETILWAHKLWRDESGLVVRALRAGVDAKKPNCPVLVVISLNDTDVKPELSRKVATWANADSIEYAGMSHVGPLLSTRAREVATTVEAWLAARIGKK
jgi:alpha-beta hydrolase superfamily lysophospholipase